MERKERVKVERMKKRKKMRRERGEKSDIYRPQLTPRSNGWGKPRKLIEQSKTKQRARQKPLDIVERQKRARSFPIVLDISFKQCSRACPAEVKRIKTGLNIPTVLDWTLVQHSSASPTEVQRYLTVLFSFSFLSLLLLVVYSSFDNQIEFFKSLSSLFWCDECNGAIHFFKIQSM